MQYTFPDKFWPLFYDNKRYYLIYGGRNGGKTLAIVHYFLAKLTHSDYFSGVVCRFTDKNIRMGLRIEFEKIIVKNQLVERGIIRRTSTGYESCSLNSLGVHNNIVFHALRVADHTQDSKHKGFSEASHLLIDEATEIDSFKTFDTFDNSIRSTNTSVQIFLCFNPSTKRHWLYEEFFLTDLVPKPDKEDQYSYIHVTMYDLLDQFGESCVDESLLYKANKLKETNPEEWKHIYLGHWSNGVQGQIYKGWEVGVCEDHEIDTIYGLDFGSTDPTACVEVKINRDRKEMWIREIMYSTNVNTQDIFDTLTHKGVTLRADIIADSASPMAISDLKRLGFINIRPCKKGPDSIVSGINRVKEFKVYVSPDSHNVWKEFDMYAWKNETGKPEDKYNHAMDAIRYALSQERLESSVMTQSTLNRWKARNSADREMYS